MRSISSAKTLVQAAMGPVDMPANDFHQVRVRDGISDGGVAADGLGQGPAPGERRRQHQLLDPPVLVAQLDLQVMDQFPLALETEVPRFDYAGVDRADRHFMDLFPLHAVERISADSPDRFEPRVSYGKDPVLFMDLPFEELKRGKVAAQAGITRRGNSLDNLDPFLRIVAATSEKADGPTQFRREQSSRSSFPPPGTASGTRRTPPP